MIGRFKSPQKETPRRGTGAETPALRNADTLHESPSVGPGLALAKLSL
jgi:hypothetical protein